MFHLSAHTTEGQADGQTDETEDIIPALKNEVIPAASLQNMPSYLISRFSLARGHTLEFCPESSGAKPLSSTFENIHDNEDSNLDCKNGDDVACRIDTSPMSSSETNLAFEKLSNAWLGTSTTSDPEWFMSSSVELLRKLIKQRSDAEARIKRSPYDPENWLNLTIIYFELGFSDLQVSSAYKALTLIKFGLDMKDKFLGRGVRDAIAKRLSYPFIVAILDDLLHRRLEAYKAVLRGLLDACAYWDGLQAAKEALEFFPKNEHLIILQGLLKEEFAERATMLKASVQTSKDVKYLTRVGRSYKRKYPWLAEKLFVRTPELLEEFNKGFNSTNCEIRRANFGTDSGPGKPDDVGPLGVFALRDVRKDEILLIDHNVSVVASTPPTKLEYCDTCHASLCSVFIPEAQVVFPKCCKDVAYCSKKCRRRAAKSYHKVLCGKDFQWLYDTAKGRELDPSWRPLILLRTFAIIVADMRRYPEKKIHPLQHPLVARLMTGYRYKGESTEQEWNYFPLVVAPNRILTQFGIDIFADPNWSAEVIHTILWRILNNACRASSVYVNGESLEKCHITGIAPGYIFFNHSCDANVTWMSAGSPDGIAWTTEGLERAIEEPLQGSREKVDTVMVGSNALLCVAARDIKKGDEARISYLPPGHREQLSRWFEDGCGCGACDGA